MSKTEADNLKKIEMSWLKKHGYLGGLRVATITWTHGYTGDKSSIGLSVSILDENPHVRFYYTQTDSNGDKKDFDYQVPLTTTSCNYGGKRYWFRCPFSRDGAYCGRRVGVLYKSGDYFACRHCYDLTYDSRNENRRYRSFHLFNTLRVRSKIDDLEQKIKRPYYGGKPTRKQRRVEHLYQQAMTSWHVYNQLEGRKGLLRP